MRISDEVAIKAQRKAFASISNNIHWQMETNVAEFEQDLKRLVEKNK